MPHDQTNLSELQRWLLDQGRAYLAENQLGLSRLSSAQRVLIEQQHAWQKRSRTRIPDSEHWLWTDRSLSQASDWLSAEFKATLFPKDELVLDACCGAGVDAVAIAGRGPVLAVDSDPWMAALAQSNASAHGLLVDAYVEPLSPDSLRGAKFLHIDPDRRAADKKTLDADQFSPPLDQVLRLTRLVDGAIIKTAPSTQFDAESLQTFENHSVRIWVANRGQCKQQLLLFGQDVIGRIPACHVAVPCNAEDSIQDGETKSNPSDRMPVGHIHPVAYAVLLEPAASPGAPFCSHWFAGSRMEGAADLVANPDRFVYDLHPTLFASQLHLAWAKQHGLAAITDHAGFYTGSGRVDSPWASAFEVVDVLAWDDRRVRKWLNDSKSGMVEVKSRLTRMDASSYQRRYTRSEGSPISLLVTRIGSQIRCIAAKRRVSGD